MDELIARLGHAVVVCISGWDRFMRKGLIRPLNVS